jgi:hypothetical protein
MLKLLDRIVIFFLEDILPTIIVIILVGFLIVQGMKCAGIEKNNFCSKIPSTAK